MAASVGIVTEDQFAYSSRAHQVLALDTNQLISFRDLVDHNPLLAYLGIDGTRVRNTKQLAKIAAKRLYFSRDTLDYLQFEMADEHYLYAELVDLVTTSVFDGLPEEYESFLLTNGLASIWQALSLFPPYGENRYIRRVLGTLER